MIRVASLTKVKTFIGERIRSLAFLSLDRLRRPGILSEVRAIEGYYDDVQRGARMRAQRMENLLYYVRERVPFYRDFGRGCLEELPVVRKASIRSDPTRFLAVDGDLGKLTRVTTSGSSGEPFECYHDSSKRLRKLADLMYFNGLAGYRVGMRHLLMRATPKGKLKQWAQNEIWVDPTRWDGRLRESVRRQLLTGKIRVAIGYPSVMADIADYCLNRGDDPRDFGISVFIATSELISPQQRDRIFEAFGCRVVSRYATEEVGVIGQAVDDCERFGLNTASLIIEVLKEDCDEAAAPGEVGRVVVTDLFLRAMPLIRYETGDLARVESVSADRVGVDVLSSLEGKITQVVFDTAGRRVAPLSILVALKGFEGIRRFQFCQKSKVSYELRLCRDGPDIDPNVKIVLERILGEDAEIDIVECEAIPALPSGKRPVVINEM